MKQALLEVMRINRICRMVLVTCLGSFALVIFYFQSMLHPVIRRNSFGMDICCRKGSRSPLQELYNPTQVSSLHVCCISPCYLWEREGGTCKKKDIKK
uniref:Uncharacterized protein n=1 Tax=Pseudonaja textilis TaxID=8673 RepID=A0A670YKE7_PSETE